jgi:DNA-binding response OmpR family regulator
MVVDDEQKICDFVSGFFEKRGHPVVMVTDPLQAIGILKTEKPQVVLLDVKMPEMSGLTLLEKIRAADKEIKVIMVTVADDETTRRRAEELGAAAFISKPFSSDYLEETVLDKLEELYPLKKSRRGR